MVSKSPFLYFVTNKEKRDSKLCNYSGYPITMTQISFLFLKKKKGGGGDQYLPLNLLATPIHLPAPKGIEYRCLLRPVPPC